MYSIMLFSRAHEESKTKPKRTVSAAEKGVKRHNNGERSETGLPYAIKAVGNNIWWSDCSDGTVKNHSYFFPIAQEIIKLAFDGWGCYRIVGYLNENYDAPRSKKDEKEGVTRKWLIPRITNFLRSRTLLGEKTVTLNGVGHTLKGYYPALLNEDEFYRLQHVRKERTSKSTSTKYSHMLSGLGI